MNEVAQQQAIVDKATARLYDLKAAERRNEAVNLIGKCFRYRNNYSLPKKPSDYWYLYSRVYGFDGEGNLMTFCFQIDKDGKVFFERDKSRAVYMLGDECPLREYRAAYRKAVSQVHKLAERAGFANKSPGVA